MKVIALTNFSGAISMCKGEEREIENKEVLKDLLSARYIQEAGKPGVKAKGKK